MGELACLPFLFFFTFGNSQILTPLLITWPNQEASSVCSEESLEKDLLSRVLISTYCNKVEGWTEGIEGWITYTCSDDGSNITMVTYDEVTLNDIGAPVVQSRCDSKNGGAFSASLIFWFCFPYLCFPSRLVLFRQTPRKYIPNQHLPANFP